MKLALTQMDIVWENPVENKKTCERLTQEASEHGCDCIVFPEMTLTGFTMHPEQFCEPFEEHAPTTQFFRSLSIRYSISIVYGYIILLNGKYYNHLSLEQQGDTLLEYDKIHPFSYGEESKHYTGGSNIMIHREPQAKEIALSGFICYDLRFPEIFQIASVDATIIFVIANWPESRIAHWHTLLQARAIENQCFIIGVNRTGEGGGLQYVPSSVAFDPYGNAITDACSDELLYAEIQPELAIQYRKDFPVKHDRRKDLYETGFNKLL